MSNSHAGINDFCCELDRISETDEQQTPSDPVDLMVGNTHRSCQSRADPVYGDYPVDGPYRSDSSSCYNRKVQIIDSKIRTTSSQHEIQISEMEFSKTNRFCESPLSHGFAHDIEHYVHRMSPNVARMGSSSSVLSFQCRPRTRTNSSNYVVDVPEIGSSSLVGTPPNSNARKLIVEVLPNDEKTNGLAYKREQQRNTSEVRHNFDVNSNVEYKSSTPKRKSRELADENDASFKEHSDASQNALLSSYSPSYHTLKRPIFDPPPAPRSRPPSSLSLNNRAREFQQQTAKEVMKAFDQNEEIRKYNEQRRRDFLENKREDDCDELPPAYTPPEPPSDDKNQQDDQIPATKIEFLGIKFKRPQAKKLFTCSCIAVGVVYLLCFYVLLEWEILKPQDLFACNLFVFLLWSIFGIVCCCAQQRGSSKIAWIFLLLPLTLTLIFGILIWICVDIKHGNGMWNVEKAPLLIFVFVLIFFCMFITMFIRFAFNVWNEVREKSIKPFTFVVEADV
ncbi:hypothetical protein M3Y98_00634900 [Aphelenchoides besseyi]|nr:hypothetical protein M3Y98_00634900 [Aphelenchoides besseyi]KAI6208511.1 hypothetical protein M3Y96_00123100 [Aphelenchoides besseyi]